MYGVYVFIMLQNIY